MSNSCKWGLNLNKNDAYSNTDKVNKGDGNIHHGLDRAAADAWWRFGVIYQIYPRSFQDSNGDGIGDIPGIISRLGYLQWLGISAIWLSPIYPSPMKDFGYDVSDYRDVHPMFGSLADMDSLIQKAHEKGIRVILDMVLNHTSDQHEWFKESCASRDNPKSDFYIWRDPSAKRYPNNWYACFGGRAWTFSPKRGQYYLHSFLEQQPDLNWRNDEVVSSLFDDIRFWLEKGVDGFRLDVINAIVKDEQLRDNPHCIGATPRPFDMQRHIHDRNQPLAHDKLRKFRSMMDTFDGRMLVGEIMVEAPGEPQKAASYLGDGNNELNLAFDFTLLNTRWGAEQWEAVARTWYGYIPEGGWPCWVLSNHDMSRAISRFGGSIPKARLAALFLLTQKGTPFIYYGEEIGMPDIKVGRLQYQDPLGKKYWPFHPGRDPERSPMQWNSDDWAGFSTVKPWLPVGKKYTVCNVAAQEHDPHSMLMMYHRLIALRNTDSALHGGDIRFISTENPHVIAYWRSKGDTLRLIVLNFSATTTSVVVECSGPGCSQAECIFNTGNNVTFDVGHGKLDIVLEGYQGYIFKCD